MTGYLDESMRGEESEQDPESSEAERAVLGLMLVSKDAVWDVQQILRPNDFGDVRHETIARAIVAIATEGGTPDPITVAEYLDRTGQSRGGLSAYVFGLDTLWSANAAHYAELVRRRAVIRQLRDAGQQIFEIASGPGDPAELVERATGIVERVSERGAGRPVPIGDGFGQFLDGIGKQQRRVKSPWPELDDLIGGFSPGRVYVIGARPGSGKSIMGLQIADRLAQTGPVAFASLEMERQELLARLTAQKSSVSLRSFEQNSLGTWGWNRLAQVRQQIEELGLYIEDRTSVYVTEIHAFARSVARQDPRPLAGIVVDYIGLIRTPDDRRGRWEHMGAISRALKVMAKELRAPVIALAQLNRESETHGGKGRPPILADLRDSGAIEQDADVVALLNRPPRDEENPLAPLLHVNIAKNRHGATGRFELAWDAERARVNSQRPAPLPDDRENP